MVGGDVVRSVDEAVAVVGDVMLYIAVAPLPYLYLGSVGVGRPEVWNAQVVAVVLGVVLDEATVTAWSGLLVPMPA